MPYDFAAHLAKYGPTSPPHLSISLDRARRYCQLLVSSHYENFSVMSLLLPPPLRQHFPAIYAYCRWADDLGDETGGGATAMDLLRWWRTELHACYEGRSNHPVMIALRSTIDTFSIPKQPFLDLLWAFEQDQLMKRYSTYDQLLDYCEHSANPVGRLVLYLLGANNEHTVPLSDAICTGLQLANFWQDVARDRAIDRVYLPEEDRRRFGYRDNDFRDQRYNQPFVNLMRFEVERTRDLFYRGMRLLELVPHEARGQIDLYLQGGLAILRKIEQIHYNVWRIRPKLGAWDKGRLMLRALTNRAVAAFPR